MRGRGLLAILFLLPAPALLKAAELKPQTLQAWNAYISAARARMEDRATGKAPFLWLDEQPDLAQQVQAGEVVVAPADGINLHPAPGGLIHDWIGAIFVPKASLDEVIGVLNDYDRYKDFYKPMVTKSSLLEQTPDHEKVTLVMAQKAYSVSAAVETTNDVDIVRLGGDREYSFSTSVHVQEIADYGQPTEHALPEDHGAGYAWRTCTITRIEQRDDGVYVEMEMMDLSRGIPWELRWLVVPLAEHLARNIMHSMLRQTRDALSQGIK